MPIVLDLLCQPATGKDSYSSVGEMIVTNPMEFQVSLEGPIAWYDRPFEVMALSVFENAQSIPSLRVQPTGQ